MDSERYKQHGCPSYQNILLVCFIPYLLKKESESTVAEETLLRLLIK